MHAIIAFRASHPERVRNLDYVLARLRAANIPTILVEQEDPHEDALPRGSAHTHVVIHTLDGIGLSTGLFRKTALYNLGLTLVPPDEPHIVFHDADVFVQPDAWRNEVYAALDKQLDLADVVSPYDCLCYLTEPETEHYFTYDTLPAPDGREVLPKACKNPKCVACHSFLLTGGIVGFRRTALTRLGGWPAGFAGWGHEDRAMAAMVHAEGLTTHRMPNIGYHLDHPHTERDPATTTANLQRAVTIERAARADR